MKKSYEVCKIEPDKDAEIIETPVAKFWIDRQGIMHSSPYRLKRTYENVKESLDILKKHVGSRKLCLISDNTELVEIPRDVRELIKKEMSTFIKAHALVSCSPMGNMINHIVFLMNKPDHPVKIFHNSEDALAWLKQFV